MPAHGHRLKVLAIVCEDLGSSAVDDHRVGRLVGSKVKIPDFEERAGVIRTLGELLLVGS